MKENDNDIFRATEKEFITNESRVKNALHESKAANDSSGKTLGFLGTGVSLLIGFASIQEDQSWRVALKWVMLALGIICSVAALYFFIISAVQKHSGKGSTEWFLREIEGIPHPKRDPLYLDLGTIFYWVIFFVLELGIPATIFLITFHINDWNSDGHMFADGGYGAFLMVIESIISLLHLFCFPLLYEFVYSMVSKKDGPLSDYVSIVFWD